MTPQQGIQRWLLPLLLTLGASFFVFWPGLGYSSLSQSEGHRAITGWQMLDSGEYLLPRLFEHLYLRKPPGMPWAVALSSAVLGQTEFAARAVSALACTLAACLSCLVACRWFGRFPGMVAGVGFALMPLFWYPGRSAEIEALNNFLCLVSMLGWVGIASRVGVRPIAALACATGCATGLMLLTKGPAGVPCTIAACIVGACVFSRVRAMVLHPAAWAALVIPAIMFGLYLALAKAQVGRLGEPAITEPPSHFLWNPQRLGQILALPLVAIASAFPQGLGLVFAFRGMARPDRHARHARALCWTCLVALLSYAAVGVANPRYAMPALTLLPMCCGVVAWQLQHSPGHLAWVRRRGGKVAAVAATILLVGAVGHAAWLEYRREFRTGGRTEGIRLGGMLPDGATIFAFEMIDQRPELLHYAVREAARLGHHVRVRWQPYPAVFGVEGPPLLPGAGDFVLLRTDTRRRDQYPPEIPEYQNHGLEPRLGSPVYSGKVHNFEFSLFQVQ